MIAAVSAAFIAAQGKLRFGDIGEQFSNVASTYNTLGGGVFGSNFKNLGWNEILA